jgi:hypothetical protein
MDKLASDAGGLNSRTCAGCGNPVTGTSKFCKRCIRSEEVAVELDRVLYLWVFNLDAPPVVDPLAQKKYIKRVINLKL